MHVRTLQLNDRDAFYKDPRVNGIVNLLLEADYILFVEVIELLNCSRKDDVENQLYSIFSELEDYPESVELFCQYLTHLMNIYNDSQLVDNLRGAVLERYVDELLCSKYNNRKNIWVNCHVLIDDWKSPRTVDNFSYSYSVYQGECFECKIKPVSLDSEDIDNLLNIYKVSERSIKPGIVCFVSIEAIKLELKEAKINISQIDVLGIENLKCNRLYTGTYPLLS